MEETINSELSKRLNTWLPIDVFNGITAFAKENAVTGTNHWDYGVAFRILLMKSQYADQMYELSKRIDELERRLQSQEVKQEVPAGYFTVKTLGDTKLNKEKQNG